MIFTQVAFIHHLLDVDLLDLDQLRRAAAGLCLDTEWRIDKVACLELRGDWYEPIAAWTVEAEGIWRCGPGAIEQGSAQRRPRA